MVDELMSELMDFIAEENGPKYDLLKAAIAHHRFVWIHPFGNGNGRTVRLLTYAMLLKAGFNANAGRIINPDNALELRYESLTCNKSAPFIRNS